MGNHCIDCKFCGRDQRMAGDNCCDENIAHEAKLEAERVAKRKAIEEFLLPFGLRPYDSRLFAADVVEALKRCGATPKKGTGQPR